MSRIPQTFLQKARKYCDYQDRCHSEVAEKLREWKAPWKEAQEILASLVVDGYLNEERFAKSFARGKFRIKGWGRRKIEAALRAKHVSDYCIRSGLADINQKEYEDTLRKIIEKEMGPKKYKHGSLELRKVQFAAARYAISRGYESELVWDIINH